MVGIIEIIFLAIANGMNEAFEDTKKVPLSVIQGAKTILEDTEKKIGKKDWYTQAEFAIKCLKLTIENIEKTADNNMCTVNIQEWYEECNNLISLAKPETIEV